MAKLEVTASPPFRPCSSRRARGPFHRRPESRADNAAASAPNGAATKRETFRPDQ